MFDPNVLSNKQISFTNISQISRSLKYNGHMKYISEQNASLSPEFV